MGARLNREDLKDLRHLCRLSFAVPNSNFLFPLRFDRKTNLKSWLLGIAPQDLTVFLLMPAVLIVVSLFASYLPARLAASVNPIETLRRE